MRPDRDPRSCRRSRGASSGTNRGVGGPTFEHEDLHARLPRAETRSRLRRNQNPRPRRRIASTELPHAALAPRPPRTTAVSVQVLAPASQAAHAAVDTPRSLGRAPSTSGRRLDPEMAVTPWSCSTPIGSTTCSTCAVAASPDPPSSGELAASLYSPDQPVIVRGRPGVGIVATVWTGPRATSACSGSTPPCGGRGHGSALLRAAEADLSALGATECPGGCGPALLPLPRGRDDADGHAVSPRTPPVRAGRVQLQHGRGPRRPFHPIPAATNWPGRASAPRSRRGCTRHWPNWEAEALRALERSTLVISRDGAGIAGFCAYDVNRLGHPRAHRGAGRPLGPGGGSAPDHRCPAPHPGLGTCDAPRSPGWDRSVPTPASEPHVSRVFFVYRRTLGPT